MSPVHCPGCGIDHHWLACPDVRQSIFPYDPEWEAEEPPPTEEPSWTPDTAS